MKKNRDGSLKPNPFYNDSLNRFSTLVYFETRLPRLRVSLVVKIPLRFPWKILGCTSENILYEIVSHSRVTWFV